MSWFLFFEPTSWYEIPVNLFYSDKKGKNPQTWPSNTSGFILLKKKRWRIHKHSSQHIIVLLFLSLMTWTSALSDKYSAHILRYNYCQIHILMQSMLIWNQSFLYVISSVLCMLRFFKNYLRAKYERSSIPWWTCRQRCIHSLVFIWTEALNRRKCPSYLTIILKSQFTTAKVHKTFYFL